MSYSDFKEISIDNTGTSTRYGGNDVKEIMQILNNKIVSTRRPKIKNEWIWMDHFDMAPPAGVPGNPTDTNASRFYIDPSSFKLKIKKTGGTIIDVENVDIPDSALSQITNKAKLPSSVVYNDQNNNLGDFYMDFGDISAPANPPAGVRRLFLNSATGELSVRTSSGTTIPLEGSGGSQTLDGLTDVEITTPSINDVLTWDGSNWVDAAPPGASGGEANTASNVGAGGLGWFKIKTGVDLRFKNINIGSNKISITDDTTNDEIDIDVVQGNLSLNDIGGAISTRSKLPTPVVYDDEANTYADLDQMFRSSRLIVRDSDDSNSYKFVGSNLAADRNVTLPLLTGNDVFVMEAFAQTLTNKTIAAGSNTISGIADAHISSHTSTKITITAKGQLNSSIVYEDEANTFSSAQTLDNYINQKTISTPADPAATYVRVYPKAVDASNDGWFAKTKENSVIVEVRIF